MKRGLRLATSCLLGLVLFGSIIHLAFRVPAVLATDHYYVDAVSGSNTGGDGSQSAPWRTITYALSQVIGPDVEIHVAAGTYDAALGENFPIVMEPTVRLIGASREETILKGNGTANVVYFPGTGFYTETTVIRGFKITNGNIGVMVNGRIGTPSTPVIEENWITGNATGVRNDAVSKQNVASTIRQNWIDHNTGRGIDLSTDYNGTSLTSIIADNEITHNGTQGIYCYSQGSGSSGDSGNSHCNPTISGNLIAYNGSDGFLCNTYYAGECRTTMTGNYFLGNNGWGVGRQHAGTYLITHRPTFINNIFSGNATGGAAFYSSSDRPQFINNTIFDNGSYGIRNGLPTIVNSIIWGHTDDLNVAVEYVSYSDVGDGEYGGLNNNLGIDPQFVDPTADNFHILGTSPLVNAGNSGAASLPLTDMDGDPRVLETAVDIGADETTVSYQLAINKSAVPTASVTIDELITYTLTVLNEGQASAAGILVTDTLPTDTTWEGDVSASSGTAMVTDGALNWTGMLLADEAATIDFAVRVNPETAVNTPIVNTASVSSPRGPAVPSQPVTLTVGPGFYWGNSVQAASQLALSGQPLTYTIQLVNSGNVSATAVTVTDTLDAQAMLLMADNDGVWSDGRIVWSNLSLAAKQTLTLTAVVTTTSPITSGYTLVNRVTIDGGGRTFQPPDVETTLINPARASFSAAPTTGPAPLSVSFSNQSQDATSFIWQYGDGSSSTAVGNHTHVYQNSGVYTVTLTAANALSSQTITHTGLITVYRLPIADFVAGPRTGATPLLVEFTNTSQYGETFVWSYGDGATSTTNAPTHSHVYASAGVYTVQLTAVNANGSNTKVRSSYISVYDTPIAAFTATPTEGIAPLAVSFTNNSLHATSYSWDFGDGTTSTAAAPTHSYNLPGVYTVKLTASNPGDSNTLVRTAYIVVHESPVASFTGSPGLGLAPLAVTFTNLSELANSYVWDYGDGSTSTNANPTHTHVYANAGVYTVRLTAVNAYGSQTQVRSSYVSVYGAPTAAFTAAPTEGAAPLAVPFTNDSLNASSYHWDFGDGQTAVSANPTHIYSQAGVYTVTLTASNPGGSDTLIRPTYVRVHEPPTASFVGSPRLGSLPLIVTFTNLSDQASSYVWDYGDGSTSTNAAYTHSHIYETAGLYTVKLTAVNSFGTDTLTRSGYVRVYDAPIPDFTAVPTAGTKPLTVQFTNQSQNATSYLWSFGDGTTNLTESPSHTYQESGVYTVTLRATNPGDSVELVRAQYITVYDVPEPAFSAAPRAGLLTLTTAFTNLSLYADSYVWDYGDGLTSTTNLPVHDHTYAMPGVYDVSLTAVNAHASRTYTETSYITVYSPVQAAFTAVPTLGPAPLSVSFANQSQQATDYTWAFGDGLTSTEMAPTHVYTAAGLYTVTLRAANPLASDTMTRTEYIMVYNGTVPSFTAVPRIGEAPLTVTFTSQSQYADSLIWEYGDGQTQVITDVQHSYTYTTPGVYTVTLTAVNAQSSNTVTRTHYISVQPPSGQPTYHVDALYGSNSSGDGSLASPWQTISHAFSQVDTADATIYVASGLYDVALGEVFPIVMESGVRLIGADRTTTIISGPGTGNVIYFTGAIGYPDTTLLQGFKITNGAAGVRIDGASHAGQTPLIDGNWITGNTDGVRTYAYGLSRYVYATISHNLISHNTRYGIFNEADSGNQSGHAYTNPVILGNEITNNGSDGIYCYADGFSTVERGNCSPQITDNEITYNAGNGVRAGAVYAGLNNFVMRENIVAYNGGWGVKRTEGPTEYWTTTRPKLYNNLINGNTLGGFNVHKEDEAVVVNNTIVNNGAYGIKRENSGEGVGYTHVINSIVRGHADNLNNIIVDWVSYSDLGDGEYSGTNYNISVDPLFVDPAQADYHLQPDSPVIDRGDVSLTDLPVMDFEGDPRIWLGGVDMGADEYFDGKVAEVGITAVPSFATAGQPLTYTLTITNLSYTPVELVLLNSLPAQVTPSGDLTYSVVLTTYHQTWIGKITTTVLAGYEGPLVNRLEARLLDQVVASTVITTPAFIPVDGLAVNHDGPTALAQPTTFSASVSEGTAVTYTWDFGDGDSGTGAVISHTYAAAGDYTAVVTAGNAVSSQTRHITVTVVEALTGLTAVSDSPTLLGAATHLTATVASGSATQYTWDYGDGDSENGALSAHVYNQAGVYTATVTAVNLVSSLTATTTVTVQMPENGVWIDQDGPTELGAATHFTATLLQETAVSFTWDFGDGELGAGQTVAHTYIAPGSYTVMVTATTSIESYTALTTVHVRAVYRLYLPSVWQSFADKVSDNTLPRAVLPPTERKGKFGAAEIASVTFTPT